MTAAVAAALLATGTVRAEGDLSELPLEQLMEMSVDTVYSASRYQQKITEAPASISIVTAEEIRRYGHRTLSEVLRSVRGMTDMTDYNYSYLGMRGFLRPNDYNTRVLVLVDGHRVNDTLFDSGTTAREGMIDVDLIERVEIVRGPSSSIYGSSAFLGVINVVTRSGAEMSGAELSAEHGSFDAQGWRASAGGTANSGVEWLVSASDYSTDGESHYFREFDQRVSDDPRARNDGLASDLDAEEALNLFTKATAGKFTLSAFYTERYKQVPTASFDTVFGEPRETTDDRRGYVDLAYTDRLASALDVQGRVYVDMYRYLGTYPMDYEGTGEAEDVVLLRDGVVDEWFGAQWQATARLLDRHTFIFGGEFRQSLSEDQYAYDDVEPREYILDSRESSRTFGLFAQGDFELLPPLTLTGGIRYDHYHETFGGTFNPRVALVYAPAPSSSLKLLYGRAFRAPNPYELYYNAEQSNQPALETERIQTYEVAYDRYIGRFRLGVSAYSFHVSDLISQAVTDGGSYYFANLDRVRARGIELEAEARLENGILARASYAHQKSVDRVSDATLTSSPWHMARLNVSVPVGAHWYVGSELQYQSSSVTLSGGRADAFVVGNLALTRSVSRGLDVSAGLYNVSDEDHAYPGAEDHLQDVLQQPGRQWRIALTYKF